MRLNWKLFSLGLVVLTALFSVTGCSNEEEVRPAGAEIQTRGPILGGGGGGLGGGGAALIGLSPNNQLYHISVGPPAQVTNIIPIGGLRQAEVIIAIDTRPSTKELFGVSNNNLLYKIDKNTGVTRQVSTAPIPFDLSGGLIGIDFDPQLDQIRLILVDGSNFRISPLNGALISTDASLGSFPMKFNGIAYTVPTTLSGTGKAACYGIDLAGDGLWQLTDPINGTVKFLGKTGYNWTTEGGFEIIPGNVAYTAQYGGYLTPNVYSNGDLLSDPAYRLFAVNLTSGKVTSFGRIRDVIGLALK